ncbi:MAG: type IV pilus twitching motility protein PilT [Elusimicrobiaceae bacterium]|nr:type IV pilus twitching motility protein PilT [Elusimicrobiaceae bacterium]
MADNVNPQEMSKYKTIIMDDLFQIMKKNNASDIHLTVGVPPVLRVQGKLYQLSQYEALTPEVAQRLIYSIMTDEQRQHFEEHLELDFSFGLKSLGRLRVNVYKQKGCVAAALRSIPNEFKSFEQLGLPAVIYNLMKLEKGLVLVTGATGSGKSTSLASMINYLNMHESNHIITVEDPIEFVHPHKRSIVNQREVGADTKSFQDALKHFLREDPDVILVGELRDIETIEACLTLAETGHLVFATLHTNDAIQSINRIIDVFPANQQPQVRTQLSFVLEAIISQQLLQGVDGRRVMAAEVLLANSAVRNLIRDGKAEQIMSTMQTSANQGMITMNQTLGELYLQKKVTFQEALVHSNDPSGLKNYLTQKTGQTSFK